MTSDGAISAPALTDDTNSNATAVPGSADAPDPAVTRPASACNSDCVVPDADADSGADADSAAAAGSFWELTPRAAPRSRPCR